MTASYSSFRSVADGGVGLALRLLGFLGSIHPLQPTGRGSGQRIRESGPWALEHSLVMENEDALTPPVR